jgi:hypothetical protein
MPISLPEPEIPKTPVQPVPKEEKIKPVEKVRKTQKEKDSTKRLQEALDEIRKRVARKEREEERSTAITSAKASLEMESKLNDYYSLVWAKIKGAWTIPENLLKVTVDLETVSVVIIERDGKIQKFWFEKNLVMPFMVRVP